MSQGEPGKHRPPPVPLDYRTPYMTVDPGFGCTSILQFCGGAVVGLIIFFVLGFATAIGSGGQSGLQAMSLVAFVLAVIAGIGFIVLLITRPRWAFPFLMGLCLGCCLAGLLDGLCFSALRGI